MKEVLSMIAEFFANVGIVKTLIIAAIALLVVVAVVALIIFVILPKIKKKGKKSVQESVKTAPIPKNVFCLEAAVVHNIGARDSQQDNYIFSDLSNSELVNRKGVLAVVADGMGGLQNGAEVSGIVTYMFKELFEKQPTRFETNMELLQMLQDANEKVNAYVRQSGGDMSGSTVVATIIKDYKLHFLSVGDSRIYLMRSGKMMQLNREHIYARDLDKSAAVKEISLEAAYSDSQRNSLTSYVGQEYIEAIDFNFEPISLMTGDTLLLMSDGVFGTLSEEEMEEAVNVPHLGQAAANLEQAVLSHQKRSQDNFTATLLRIQ